MLKQAFVEWSVQYVFLSWLLQRMSGFTQQCDWNEVMVSSQELKITQMIVVTLRFFLWPNLFYMSCQSKQMSDVPKVNKRHTGVVTEVSIAEKILKHRGTTV